MSNGPSKVKTTTTNTPPEFLVGPLTTATNAAQNQFLGGGAQPIQPQGGFGGGNVGRPGEPEPNFGTPPIGTGINTGGQGPGQNLIGQAQGLTGQSLAGDFLSPDSNPFLTGTFNRAADLTQTRLNSEFAGAGRDLGAALPARSEELQTLASNIFGGNFQAERDRQLQSVHQAQGLDPLNMFINQLAGIIPGAGGVTTSQQPVSQSGLF